MDNRTLPLIDSSAPLPVLAQILQPIEDLLKESVDVNYQGERVLQLLRLERADYFYRGIQNLAPSMDPSSGALFWSSYGSDGAPIADQGEFERVFDYNPRLTKSYGDKFCAVMGQRPFYNTTAEALDPTSERDRRGARQVNLLLQMLHGQWNVRILNHRLAYYIYKTGTAFGHVRPLTDGKRFGTFQVPRIEQQPQEVHPAGYICPNCGAFTPSAAPGEQMDCAQCGRPLEMGMWQPPLTVPVPVQTGVNTYERTSVDLTLLNGYTMTHPFNVVDLPDSPWIVNECEKDWGELLDAHPNARGIVGDDGGAGGMGGDTASATAAVVRAAAQSQTGTIRSRNTTLRTYRNIWLAPSRLQLIRDPGKRAAAMQAFPDGLKIIQIEGKTVSVRNEDFKQRLSACPPGMADYLFADGVCWGIFGLEDGVSNLLNISQETLETGIPRFLVNQNYADAQTLNRNRYSPNRFIPTLPKAGETMGNAFALFPTADFPQQIPEMFQVFRDFIENSLGLLPQVYGQMPQNLTLGQARMMLNQGLMQLGTVGELMTRFWEQTDTNAVNLYAQVSQVNPSYKGESIDLDLIRSSKWVIKGNSTMPRTYSERKETLQEIITQNPDMAKAMNITDPVNYPDLTDYLDLPEMKNPAADMVIALQEIVDQLWNAAPVQAPDGTMQSMPVQFDPVVFDAKTAVSVAQASLVDSLGQQRQNTPGYANVRAFLQAAQNALDQQSQAAPDPPRLSLSLALDKAPSDQEMAVLQKFGINVPPPQAPSLDTISKVTQNEQSHQHRMEQQAAKPQLPAQGQGAPPVGAPPVGVPMGPPVGAPLQ